MLSCRLDIPEQHRESSLKYQTRCVAAFSGAYSFAVASVEGRVAMEILDPSPEAQEKKYAFKVSWQGERTLCADIGSISKPQGAAVVA